MSERYCADCRAPLPLGPRRAHCDVCMAYRMEAVARIKGGEDMASVQAEVVSRKRRLRREN